MKVIDIPISELKPYERNPRNNENAVDAVAESIKQFGFKQPIVIDSDHVIICGHTRLLAAKKLNIKKVPCVLADDLTEEQIKAYRLADNKVSELAGWNDELLAFEMDCIGAIDMSAFGFDIDAAVSPDQFGDEFQLPDGDKQDICKMTFIVHTEQKSLIEYAMSLVKNNISETFGNSNKNGNALYEVVRQWAEQRK